MDVYEAVKQMRAKSERGESFSFAFMSYSYERGKSEGIVKVENARLRKQSTPEKNRFANYMLGFYNLDSMQNGSCWQMLLLEYEGQELELN